MDFSVVTEFENKIAEFFGAPYAVAVDSCTHGIELCLRLKNAGYISCPKHTYLSVPMLANKLNIPLLWRDENWVDYYCVHGNIYDAAVLWKKDSYLPGTFMVLSHQYQKHLKIGRMGTILCDNESDAIVLKKMSYDGRKPNLPWRNQDIDSIGFHYYCTPENAKLALDKLDEAIATSPRQWKIEDWPDLTKMDVFKDK